MNKEIFRFLTASNFHVYIIRYVFFSFLFTIVILYQKSFGCLATRYDNDNDNKRLRIPLRISPSPLILYYSLYTKTEDFWHAAARHNRILHNISLQHAWDQRLMCSYFEIRIRYIRQRQKRSFAEEEKNRDEKRT